jgi:hypothetical protein
MIARIIIGTVVAILGLVMTIKSEWMFQQFGRIAFAEKYLGLEGGTRLFYRILGVLLFIGGILWASGAIQRGFVAVFS